MPEPITPELAQPQRLTIGETPVYLKSPLQIDGQEVAQLTVKGAGTRSPDGLGSAVVLMKTPSLRRGEEGQDFLKSLGNVNDMEEIDWEKIGGIQWTAPDGSIHTITKDQLSLAKPEETPSRPLQEVTSPPPSPEQASPSPTVQAPEPKLARKILETYSGEPTTLTIVGLKAYETRAHDLADKAMQLKTSLGERIWKQGIGPVYFHERLRQYYLEMLKASNSPFASESIRIAEAAGRNRYQDLLKNKNFLTRGSRRLIEWMKDNLGMKTLVQKFSLEEIGHMKETGEIKERETFDREATSIRKRFEMDVENQDEYIRKSLGENIVLLDQPEHKPLVDEIKRMVRAYASGEIATKKDFDAATDTLFQTHLKSAEPALFEQAELYTSSLYEVAENLRTKASHEGGLAAIDAQLESMQVKLGMGVMGEATALEPTDVQRGSEMVRSLLTTLEKKGVTLLVNEATVSSGVALALSLVVLPKMALSGFARGVGGVAGGAAVGALFGGIREYRMLEREYLTHLREREAGLTFSPDAKRRAWMERFFVGQRNADELIAALTKETVTEDDVRLKLATLADAKARKALSAREHARNAQRVGMIQYSGRENIETQRTALDLTIAQTEKDLLASGKTNEQFLSDLTAAQTRVLNEGVAALEGLDDPIKVTLGLLDKYNPQVEVMRRRFPLLGPEAATGEKAQGLEDILKEFRRAARGEAVRKGLVVGATGALIGLGVREVLQGGMELGANVLKHTPDLSPAEMIHGQEYQFSNNLHLDGTNLVKDTVGGKTEVVVAGFKDYIGNTHGALNPDGTLSDNTKFWLAEQARDHGFKLEIPPAIKTEWAFDPKLPPHTLADLTTGQPIQAPQELHWVFTPEGRQLVVDVKDAAGNPFQQVLFADAGHQGEISGGLAKIIQHPNLQYIPESHMEHSAPFDSIKIPGLSDLIDKNGVAHPLFANIPEHTTLSQIPGTHTYNLLDANGGTLLHGIDIDDHGRILNLAVLQAQADANHLNITMDQLPGVTTEVPGGGIGGTFDKAVSDMGTEHGASGPWGWLEDPINADSSVSHHLPGTNLAKNLFRGTFENYYRAEDHVTGTFRWDEVGHAVGEKVNYNAMQPDALFHDVPKALFEDGQLVKLGHIIDRAIGIQENQGVDFDNITPADFAALGIKDQQEFEVLRAAYEIGRVGRVATKDEVQMFIDFLGGAGSKEVTTPIFQPTIEQIVSETIPGKITGIPGTVVTNIVTLPEAPVVPELPYVPIPIVHRRPLEEGTPGVSLENILILYGYGGSYSREGLGWVNRGDYEKRRSKRLNENPYAKLDEATEVADYLSRMNPGYRAELEAMDRIIGAPMSTETRAVITLPVFGEGKNIRKTLEQFLNQKDKEGNLIDPNRFEIIVFENDTVDRPKDEAEDEIRRFKAAHPEMKIHYAFRRWTKEDIANQVNTVGNGRRYACDLALLRSSKRGVRPPGDLAIVNSDADLEGITSQYIADVLDIFDSQEELDYVIGKRTLPNWALQKPNVRAGQRLWETFDAVMRHTGGGESLEPTERKAGWPGLIGENSAMRASIYAAVGGYGEKARLAEDQNLGDMIRAARKYDDARFKYINRLETIKNPRRYLTYMVAGEPLINMYNDYHENKDIRTIDNQQLLTRIPDTFDLNRFQLDADGIYQKKQDYQNLGDEGFETRFKKTMDLMGAEFVVENGHVKITNAEALMRGLSKPV